jgi:hypothetical protein
MVIRRSDSSGLMMRSPTVSEDLGTVAVYLRKENITGSIIESSSDQDKALEIILPGTYDPEYDIVLENKPINTAVTFESLTPNVATVDSTGKVSRVGDGTAIVQITSQFIRKRISVDCTQVTGVSTSRIVGWVEGSLMYHITNDVTTRLTDKVFSTDAALYVMKDNATKTYTRNTVQPLSDIDMSCLSVYNSYGGTARAGVLVTPDIVIFARHYPLGVGTTLWFVTTDNVTISRTVTATRSLSGSGYQYDLSIARLDTPIVSGVTPCKVVSSDIENYLPNLTAGVPTFTVNRYDNLGVGMWYSTDDYNRLKYAWSTPESLWDRELIVGDSGSPFFLIINNEPILLTTATFGGAGTGPCLQNHITAINNLITAVGSDSSLVEVDLSSFTNYVDS